MINGDLTTIRNQATEIETLQKEVASYRTDLEHLNEEHLLRKPAEAEKPAEKPARKSPAKKAAAKKPAARKGAAKKEAEKPAE